MKPQENFLSFIYIVGDEVDDVYVINVYVLPTL